jgi:hypothetical protein
MLARVARWIQQWARMRVPGGAFLSELGCWRLRNGIGPPTCEAQLHVRDGMCESVDYFEGEDTGA